MLRTLARTTTWTLIMVLAVFLASAVMVGRAHPIWDAVCITGQVMELDGTRTTWPTTCDQTGWQE